MSDELFFLIIPVLIIVGGILIVLMGIWRQTKMREYEHRERLAMIERGADPPPLPLMSSVPAGGYSSPRHARYLSGGIIVIGIGLALMAVIGFAGETPNVAFGIGGAVVILGVAFVVNALVGARMSGPVPPDPSARALPSPPPTEPPAA
ncbi:MAG: DUF6249 domain-containing protein [Vicinamibacterales bacterium]